MEGTFYYGQDPYEGHPISVEYPAEIHADATEADVHIRIGCYHKTLAELRHIGAAVDDWLASNQRHVHQPDKRDVLVNAGMAIRAAWRVEQARREALAPKLEIKPGRRYRKSYGQGVFVLATPTEQVEGYLRKTNDEYEYVWKTEAGRPTFATRGEDLVIQWNLVEEITD